MKKLLSLTIAVFMLLSLCSCGFINMKGEEVELNYDTAKMQENMDKLRNEDGIYVELLITSYESGDKPVTGTMAYAETADMFYFRGEASESYYDFSDETKTVMFDKNEEGVWVRSEVVYAETGMTREQMEAQCELQASAIFTYLDMYEQFNGQKMKKTTTEIAGRTCDEFNISVGIMGYGMSYVFAVDPETGMCLKWQISASAGMEGSASASFTCNKFESPYTIKLPTDFVDADDLNEDETNEGGGNNSGNGNGAGTSSGSEDNTTLSLADMLRIYGLGENDFKPDGFKEFADVSLLGELGGIQSMLSFNVVMDGEVTADNTTAWYETLYNKMLSLSDTDTLYADMQGATKYTSLQEVIDGTPVLTDIPGFSVHYPSPIDVNRAYLQFKVTYTPSENSYSVFIWIMNFLR